MVNALNLKHPKSKIASLFMSLFIAIFMVTIQSARAQLEVETGYGDTVTLNLEEIKSEEILEVEEAYLALPDDREIESYERETQDAMWNLKTSLEDHLYGDTCGGIDINNAVLDMVSVANETQSGCGTIANNDRRECKQNCLYNTPNLFCGCFAAFLVDVAACVNN